MYGKIFTSMYDGTLADNWEALITFQQMIVLSNAQGIIDMTTIALSRRTGIPIDVIEKGIKILEKPDKYSRTNVEDGRRISLIDEHKPWGWYIVNHLKYRNIGNHEDKKKADRIRIAEKRRLLQIATNSDKSREVVKVAHTDTDTDTDTTQQTLVLTSDKKVLKKNKKRVSKKEKEKGFEDWWKIYIRKVNKPTSKKYWVRDNLYLRVDELIVTLLKQNQNKYSKLAMKFVPHPSTYLNRKNYEDENDCGDENKKFRDQNYETTNTEDLKWMN